MQKDEFWLSVPQAVVLEATGKLEWVFSLTSPDPDVLVAAANRYLVRYTEVPLPEDATDEQKRDAVRKLRQAMPVPARETRYLEVLGRVHARTKTGVTVKAARFPGGPYETVDGAELSRIQLEGVDATDKRTGATLLYDLRIHGREFVESLAASTGRAADLSPAPQPTATPEEEASQMVKKWDVSGDPLPELTKWALSRWGNNLDRRPGRAKLLEEFRLEKGLIYGINEKTMRALRHSLVSDKARRGGTPTHRR